MILTQLNLITLDDIFNNISIKFINSLKEYKLMDDNIISFRKKEVKRFFFHHAISDILPLLRTFSVNKTVIVIYPNILYNKYELYDYVDESLVKLNIKKCLCYLKTFYYDRIVFLNSNMQLIDAENVILNDVITIRDVTYKEIKKFSNNNELKEVYENFI